MRGRSRRAAFRRPTAAPGGGRAAARCPAARRYRRTGPARAGARREPAPEHQILAHGQMREQAAFLKDVADPAAMGRERRRRDRYRAIPSRRSAICPRCGRISPAMALTTEVLPAPERPNSAVRPRPLAKWMSSAKAAETVLDVDRGARGQSPEMRRPICRARSSEASSASSDRITATAVRRSAAGSPPGVWVRV